MLLVAFCAFYFGFAVGDDIQSSVGRYNHFVKTPSSEISTGGRITERHIQYIGAAGYKSLLSIVEFPTDDTVYNGVSGNWPSSSHEAQLAQSAGMVDKYVVSSLTIESANKIADLIDELPKPIYMHCHVGYTATLFAQMYFFLRGQIDGQTIYANGLKYGYDYQASEAVVSLLNSLTGRTDTVAPEQIEQTLSKGESSYKYYYWTHRAGNSDYWYNMGQVLDTHVSSIAEAGYKSVVNFRQTGESTTRLSTDPSTGAIDNNEFSDASGNYDVTLEQAAFTNAGMHYFYLPVNSGAASSWSLEQFNTYKPTMQEAESYGPVLSHCASGYRSSAFVLAYIAQKNKQCTDWALQQALWVGFNFYADTTILSFWKEILGC